jgi:uncharacterized OB-fold protein
MTQDDLAHCHVVPGKLALPYQYFAGRTGSKFLVALRDQRKILAVRCDRCGKTSVPPRQSCERCQADLAGSWVEVGPAGTVEGFTVVRYEAGHLPRKPPYILALVRLDGADTPLAHIVEGVAPEVLEVGQRVRAVFSEKPTSTILDIDHFEPLPR